MLAPSSSPGGPKLSSTKKRRLAALEDSLLLKKQRSSGPSEITGSPKPVQKVSTSLRSQLLLRGKESQSAPYDVLDETVSSGPLSLILKMQRSSRLGRTVEDLLAQPEHGLGDQDSVQQAINLKVTDRTIMLDNPATARPAKPIPANRQRGLLSRKACKKLGLYQMAKQTGLRYEMFEPLHERWKQYMKDLTNSQSGVEDRLLTADLHGCLVRVESAKQTCFFGREGIIIKSTLNTFCILSPSNQISIIPKAGTFFSYLYQPKRRVHLNGTKLPSFGM
ncbi:hypothetical protein WJX84_012361 [Apatococcus fuscideae]|uniref:Uncharacterized protein n=1 Tax=Apatococcus fuscideae TaxID=2026836 RepID=A0AAW1SUZ2_9CHLO